MAPVQLGFALVERLGAILEGLTLLFELAVAVAGSGLRLRQPRLGFRELGLEIGPWRR